MSACDGCDQLRAELVALADILRTHLRNDEARRADEYIAFGPEPSDDISEIIERLKGATG